MCLIARYSICKVKEEMYIYVCKNLANLIQKICTPNNNINRMYIMYDMGRTYPRGGQHYIAMEKVEDALHFQDNVKILVESTKRVEEINSSQRQEESAKRQEDLAISQEKLAKSQEKLAKNALYVAIVMIIPGVLSSINDITEIANNINKIYRVALWLVFKL